jgi:hypothetical protein
MMVVASFELWWMVLIYLLALLALGCTCTTACGARSRRSA